MPECVSGCHCKTAVVNDAVVSAVFLQSKLGSAALHYIPLFIVSLSMLNSFTNKNLRSR